jgi:hypothetical protein
MYHHLKIRFRLDGSLSIYYDDGPGVRVGTLEKTLHAIADIYIHARPDGILSVRFLNDNKGRKNVKPESVYTIIKNHTCRGVTRIGTELERKILDHFVYEPKIMLRELKAMEKPLLVMIITDGTVILSPLFTLSHV